MRDHETHKSMKFKVCLLTPLLGKVKLRSKNFNRAQEVGFIEFQMRRILQVPAHGETRLWFAEKEGTCQPLFDRTIELENAFKREDSKSYALVLEVKDPNGMWPSGLMLPTTGELLKFNDITRGHFVKEESNFKDSVQKLTDNLNTQVVSLVEHLVSSSTRALDFQRKQYQKLHEETQSTYDEYQHLTAEYRAKLTQLKDEQFKLYQEKEAFKEAQEKFNAELKQMEDLNKITESVVTLNVGGHIYKCSLTTLTADPDSMLALMFSGRYPLSRLSDGSYFIDRDGKLFAYVLECLRNGSIEPETLPQDTQMLFALYREADYYQVRGMPNGKDLNVFNFSNDFFKEDYCFSHVFDFSDDLFEENEDD